MFSLLIGNASLYPHKVTVTPSHSVELSQSETGLCLFKQNAKDCLLFVDDDGNKFSVNSFGKFDVVKSSKEVIRGNG